MLCSCSNTVALQLQNVDNAEVTSDYALLIPSRLRLEGLIWQTTKHAKSPMYQEPGFGPKTAVTGDEKGWYSKNDQVFIWDSPEEALDNDNGASLDLPVDDDYIDLKEYIGVRVLKENLRNREVKAEDWAACEFTTTDNSKYYGQEEYYNLHYEFYLVDYEVAGNVTLVTLVMFASLILASTQLRLTRRALLVALSL